MNTKMKCKIAVDVVMSILLLLLMAYQVVGEELHEIFGTVMVVLFIMHHILNIRWYMNLLKGRYTLQRVFMALVNFSLLVAMCSLTYSGIVLSRHVFKILPITKGMALARVMHLSASYWGFVLMSVHIGLHWGMVTNSFHKRYEKQKAKAFLWGMRLIAVMIAIYGFICFYQANVLSYMFLRTEFAFFDYEEAAAFVFGKLIAMMGFWIFISYYLSKGISKIKKIRQERRSDGL